MATCREDRPAQQWSLALIPDDWAQKVGEADLLFAAVEPEEDLLASVGNGYLSTTVGSDTIYVSGVFNGLGSRDPSHRARIPSPLAITVDNAVPYASGLDLKEAAFYRRSYVDSVTPVEQRWYASRETLRSTLVHELSVSAQLSGPVTLSLSVRPGLLPNADIDFVTERETDEVLVQCGSTRVAEIAGGELTRVCTSASKVPPSVTIPAGSNATLVHIFSVRTSLDSADPLRDVSLDFAQAVTLVDNGDLWGDHTASWGALWGAGIQVDTLVDQELAQAVNSSLYYILSSVRDDWPHSLSPGGLASNGYNGHTFWDCETWVYPILLSNYPSLALSTLKYRLDRLEGARAKAQSYNPPYRGTMFPWESAATGVETTPVWADTGLYEIHISGDIVFAVQQHYLQSGDFAWLVGYQDLVLGVAEFWESRVKNVTLPGGYEFHIAGVIPPDEYAHGDNSVFTNVVAKISLEFAADLLLKLGTAAPSGYSAAVWMDIANRLRIPFDTARNVHLEYDGYQGALIKQADVVLLGYPLNWNMSQAVRANDANYYIERTDEFGPAMTWGMYAIAYLELNQPEKADPLFR